MNHPRKMQQRLFRCQTCGTEQDAPKVRGRTPPGHIKTMYCYKCQFRTNHIQIDENRKEEKMKDLTVFEHSGGFVIDSREVAEMVGKEHAKLIRDIRTYIEYLVEAKIGFNEYFIESTYRDSYNNRTLPCYLITRKGCDMVANKLTGEKGVLFTAAYVDKFHAMEQSGAIALQNLSPQLQFMINIETQQKAQQAALDATNQRIDDIRDTVQLNTTSWREDSRKLLVKNAHKMGGNEYIQDVQSEIYRLVELRAGVSLTRRLANKRQRMAYEGISKSQQDKVNRVDVIGEDKKLIEIYVAIVKEMSIKNGVSPQ